METEVLQERKRERDERHQQEVDEEEMQERTRDPDELMDAFELLHAVEVLGPPYFDSVTGEVLDAATTEKAMEDEIENMRKMQVKEDITNEAAVKLGGRMVSTRWVLRSRAVNPPKVKARIVAREINDGSYQDAYAASPTTTGQRLLLFFASLMGWMVTLPDVSAAFLQAMLEVGEEVCVIPPLSARAAPGKPGEVWRLKRALYGLRQSPRLFQQHLEKVLESIGFRRLVADAQLWVSMKDGKMQALLSVHADDMLLATAPGDMEECLKKIESVLVIKRGEELTSGQFVKYLGREWCKTDHGYKVRAPVHYYTRMLSEYGLLGCRSVATPFDDGGKCEDPLPLERARLFRTVVGQLM